MLNATVGINGLMGGSSGPSIGPASRKEELSSLIADVFIFAVRPQIKTWPYYSLFYNTVSLETKYYSL